MRAIAWKAKNRGNLNTLPADGINFSDNVIVPAPGATTAYGGCIFVYKAQNVTIKNNTIIGTDDCYPVQAQKVQGLTIEGNRIEGYRRTAKVGPGGIKQFQPSGVIWISVATGKIDENCTEACEYRIHYADSVTIRNNYILQHVKFSSGVDLEGVDGVNISDNLIAADNKVQPAGLVNNEAHVGAVAIMLGGIRSRKATPTETIGHRSISPGWTPTRSSISTTRLSSKDTQASRSIRCRSGAMRWLPTCFLRSACT